GLSPTTLPRTVFQPPRDDRHRAINFGARFVERRILLFSLVCRVRFREEALAVLSTVWKFGKEVREAKRKGEQSSNDNERMPGAHFFTPQRRRLSLSSRRLSYRLEIPKGENEDQAKGEEAPSDDKHDDTSPVSVHDEEANSNARQCCSRFESTRITAVEEGPSPPRRRRRHSPKAPARRSSGGSESTTHAENAAPAPEAAKPEVTTEPPLLSLLHGAQEPDTTERQRVGEQHHATAVEDAAAFGALLSSAVGRVCAKTPPMLPTAPCSTLEETPMSKAPCRHTLLALAGCALASVVLCFSGGDVSRSISGGCGGAKASSGRLLGLDEAAIFVMPNTTAAPWSVRWHGALSARWFRPLRRAGAAANDYYWNTIISTVAAALGKGPGGPRAYVGAYTEIAAGSAYIGAPSSPEDAASLSVGVCLAARSAHLFFHMAQSAYLRGATDGHVTLTTPAGGAEKREPEKVQRNDRPEEGASSRGDDDVHGCCLWTDDVDAAAAALPYAIVSTGALRVQPIADD
ncbi:unnamed protein product, partial [Phaeothamnion confervicola]